MKPIQTVYPKARRQCGRELEAVAAGIPGGIPSKQIARRVRIAQAVVALHEALRAAELLPALYQEEQRLAYQTFGIGIGDRKADLATRIRQTMAKIRSALAQTEPLPLEPSGVDHPPKVEGYPHRGEPVNCPFCGKRGIVGEN